MSTNWLHEPDLGNDADLRLFCLPYAGGNAGIYQPWLEAAPGHVAVCPVELPGHGRRFGDTPISRWRPLVHALANALEPELDRPFVLFGHSLGALLAFELTRTLRARGLPQPEHLYVSGGVAPGSPSRRPSLHNATDEELTAELKFLGGTPQALLENDELMRLMLPTLRADFSVLETYEYRDEPPLSVPLTAFAGRSDHTVPVFSMSGWRTQTTARARLRLLPGDHFFVHTAMSEILTEIGAGLPRPLATVAAGSR